MSPSFYFNIKTIFAKAEACVQKHSNAIHYHRFVDFIAYIAKLLMSKKRTFCLSIKKGLQGNTILCSQ